MSMFFLTRLEEINTVAGQAQLDYVRAEAKPDLYSEWWATYFKPL